MIITAIFLLCSFAWVICAARGNERIARVAVAPVAIVFALIYVFISEKVAQDREQYYQWYVHAQSILESGGGTDPGFTLLLTALPNNLQQSAFGLIFSGLLFTALAFFAYCSTRQKPDGAVVASLVTLLAVTDRLFLDLCANTSRSSLAGLLLLTALVIRHRALMLVLILLASSIHAKFTALTLLVTVLAYTLQFRPRWQIALLGIGLFLFCFRATTGRTLFDDLAIIELLLASDREDIRRGALITTGVTGSRTIQIVLAVLIPLALAKGNSSDELQQANSGTSNPRTSRSVAVTFSAVAMILYPEIQLAERLFLVPLLLLPTLTPLNRLKALAALKIPIICAALLAQFEKIY